MRPARNLTSATTRIVIRVTAVEVRTLREAAHRTGTSLANFVRVAALAAELALSGAKVPDRKGINK